ncbi:MAG: DUF3488 and DUF4129 domain-containing transglutaminase family protein [Candidatus Limnocylindrales bacterium]
MTVGTGIVSGGATRREQLERPLGPAEGWTTVLLLVVMLAAVGVAVDDARWVGLGPSGASRTWFMPLALVFGGIWGIVGAKLHLPTLLIHLIGAFIGALLLIFLVAETMSAAPALDARVQDLLASLATFMDDLLVRHVRSGQSAPFMLGAGLVAWATGQFAGFAVFRRHRPIDAVLVAGLALIVNLSLTFKPEFNHLVVFASAALLLLVRSNLFKQRTGWLRRRIGDVGQVSDLFMRSGLSFVAVALVGSLALTSVASSAPLAGAWHGFDRTIVKVGDVISRLVGGVDAPARGPNALFAPDQPIPDRWFSSNEVVFRARTSDNNAYYWQATTYDSFDGQAWHQTDATSARVEAKGDLLSVTHEQPTGGARNSVTATVTAVSLGGDLLLSPSVPISVDRSTNVWTSGTGGPMTMVEFADGLPDGASYTVQAAVRASKEAQGGLTQSKLAAAGRAYPDWLTPYRTIQPGSVGPLTEGTANAILQSLPLDRRDDFHIADAIQTYLNQTGGFHYAIDVSGLCSDSLVVECFLSSRAGFCEHFATTMVMLLRELDIPSRLVMGYLPGQRGPDGVWQVTAGAAHAWVEVYFPGYGWVVFDPTPGNQANGQQAAAFEQGAPLPSPDSSPGSSVAAPRRTIRPDPTDIGATVGPARPFSGTGGSALLITLVVLAVLAVLILAVTVRRRRRPAAPPEVVYRGVARLAGWFGYGPRPTQTAYEYAAGLGDVVPGARPELQLVARAKVEATYGRRQPGPEGMTALRLAYRRLQLRLLGLAFRRRRS